MLFVAARDIGLMLLFPPYNSIPAGRDVAAFDAFHFAFGGSQNRIVNWNLLTLELCWVLANAAIVNCGILWLMFRDPRPARGTADHA